MTARPGYFALLLVIGAGWGLTQPLAKIAVSTGYLPFGLIVWQLAISVLVLAAINRLRGHGLPLAPRYLAIYLLIALLGTVIPNSISYRTAVHLPSGFLSILISLVPIFALPLALAIGMERFSAPRLIGILCGAGAILLLILPQTALPDRALAVWVLIGALSPLMYAIEGTWVARFGTRGLDPVQVLLGASLCGLLITVPLALATGQWVNLAIRWQAPEMALALSSVIHALVYTAYVWLVGRAGSVFASQVSYIVTVSGVGWAMLILAESYSGWFWVSLALMLLGLFLVQPRGGLAPATAKGETGA